MKKLITALLLAVSSMAYANTDVIGVHVATEHEATWYNNANPGLFYRSGETGNQYGFYCNSYSRYGGRAWDTREPKCQLSFYAAKTWETNQDAFLGLGLTVGVATGYPNGITVAGETLLPSVAPSLRVGYARFSFLRPHTVHMNLEFQIK